jgi:ADP-ribose pyrophosphatase YjhB (NUDIX family)
MKFCSECGVRIPRQENTHAPRRYTCVACRTTHYENPRVIVSCIVCWNNTILLCRRSQEPARGQWAVPSGFLECGETLEECAVRETMEETGVTVDAGSLELYSVTNMTAIEQVAVAFRVTVTADPHPRPGPESLEVAFMSEADVATIEFAWRRSMGNSLERLFREIRTGDFSIKLATLGSEEGIGFKARRYGIGSALNIASNEPTNEFSGFVHAGSVPDSDLSAGSNAIPAEADCSTDREQ